jgi:PAS domain S-box-containing protein
MGAMLCVALALAVHAAAPVPPYLWAGLTIGVVGFAVMLAYLGDEAARRLSRSESKLSVVIDHAVDGLISIDERGTIEHLNPASERLFGYRAKEVLGRNIDMLMAPPGNVEAASSVLSHLSRQQPDANGRSNCDVLARRKDGSVFAMELTLSGFQLRDGRYVPGILRDISARKQVEERKALLAAIVASSDDAIISETLDGIVTSWNASAERLLGYSAEEMMGKPASLIVPPDRLEENERLARLCRGEEIQRLETMRLMKDGHQRNVSLAISPVRNTAGAITGVSVIMRDISARKKAESDLLRYMKALERSNQELDDFAYIASHDLKEPLRGLLANTAFLQEDYQDKLGAEGLKRLERLRHLSLRMEQLVSDLLAYSRISREDMAIQPTDVNAAIHDIESMMETTLREQNAAILIPAALPKILCDKTAITEIFRNLITNGVKYNNAARKIIEVGYFDELATKNGTERHVFYVKDNGIGIAEEFHEDIFRMFKRLNAEAEDKKGSGVGLTFVRKIVDRHGGRIWVASEPDNGTVFYFTLMPSVADDLA